MRTSLLRGAVRALSLLALLLGLAPASQAFTLFQDPVVRKVSIGGPPDAPSETSPGPRYSVSDDGCSIVFTSTAKNMIAGQIETNGGSDVFLYSCGTDKVEALVSHSISGLLRTSNGVSDQPVISPDGDFVVFRSTGDDIVTTDPNGYHGQTNVFLWSRADGSITLISHATGSALPGDDNSQNGVISRGSGGRIVAFESVATNLVPLDGNKLSDVFRSVGGSINRVSIGSFGEGDGDSVNPVIDSSGNCVAFESAATNLVSSDGTEDKNGNKHDVFVWQVDKVILLSHIPGSSVTTGKGESTEPSISDDCKTFAFKSTAPDLSAGQSVNSGMEVFYEHDLLPSLEDAVLVSHTSTSDKDPGSAPSSAPILSRDGNWIAYASLAKDLMDNQNDSTGLSDVFVYHIPKNLNTLVSHNFKDPLLAAGGPSSAPEISTDGRYIAFESAAKDLDLNQNDSNGDRDVFLYYTLWNNSVVASRRFASIAITGNRQSFRPALSGSGYVTAFASFSADLIADDPETSGLEDVFFFRSLGRMQFLSARSTDNLNTLEWVTPPTNMVSMQAFVNPGGTCPTTYGTASLGTALTLPLALTSNQSFQISDPSPPNTDRCYSFFIERDSGPIQAGDGPAQDIVAHTLIAPTGNVRWASNVAGLTSLAQVGIGAQNVVAVAQDGGVYGLDRGPAGGSWAGGYWPFRTDLFDPIQGRPPILTLALNGATHTTFVGAQDGRVYALDADRGSRFGGAIWYTTPAIGPDVEAGVAGMFTLFGGLGDHLLVGTRPGSGPAQFYALDPATGALQGGSPFTGALGAINTSASVDYTRKQVYFASLELTGVDPSLWCLKLNAGGLGSTCWLPRTLPAAISGGPVERNGTVYVGDDAGNVWAFDAALGGLNWPGSYFSCGGAVKSFVFTDRQGTARDFYYATTGGLCAGTDVGPNPTFKWLISTAAAPAGIPGPSAPLLIRIGGVAYVYVGSTDGSLYQIEADNPTVRKSVLLRTGATIGSPAFDVRDNMIYVGSDAGAIYAVQAPY